jgi:acyl dehydratase
MRIASMSGKPGAMPPPAKTGLYFEDIQPGASWTTLGVVVTETDMIQFALVWDPHPFHIDKEAGKASVFGDLCASGLQTLLVTYKSFMGLKIFEGTTLAGMGMDQLKFHAPVFADDMLIVRITVEEAIPTSKPDRGLLKLRLRTHNQAATLLSEFLLPMLIKRRHKQPGSGDEHVKAI